jgi:hypothetical protein
VLAKSVAHRLLLGLGLWLAQLGSYLFRVKREYALSSFSDTNSTPGFWSLRMI